MENNSLKILEIKDKKIWEDFNLGCSNPAYFQSWTWGEVEKKRGTGVYRFGIFEREKIKGIFQIFEIKAKRGHFLQIRQGPVLKEWKKELFMEIINFVKKLAREKSASFIRISPLLGVSDQELLDLTAAGFRMSPVHNVDAENRWVLDINKDQKVLLSQMRKTTRYMIKKGENIKINVIRSKDSKDIKLFLKIYYQTAKNKKFIPHSLISEEFEEFGKEGDSILYLAELDKNILAGTLIIYYGKEAIYRHGATSFEGRNTPASYLLQWEAIKDAKEKGIIRYNFWGIARDDNPKNPWYGLSCFKKGFGGYQIDFVHSMDLPTKPTYWISFLIDYFTKVKKGYNI
ncbi:MAG: hypothetical protein A2857_03295 [Candidatus Levybacteria bacterium RIFCSPHIGHO2_01_FULL_36_15]|nr:MAG: hypothetical protein A2857_03295 [Candidatus Levybacteria bacterium RIFCSPHIGHO2_01_FULL_36_15]